MPSNNRRDKRVLYHSPTCSCGAGGVPLAVNADDARTADVSFACIEDAECAGPAQSQSALAGSTKLGCFEEGTVAARSNLITLAATLGFTPIWSRKREMTWR